MFFACFGFLTLFPPLVFLKKKLMKSFDEWGKKKLQKSSFQGEKVLNF